MISRMIRIGEIVLVILLALLIVVLGVEVTR